MPFRSFQHRPLRQQVPQLSRKAKLRCVVAQCVCVCAGRHSWWWPGGRAGEQRRAGRRPSGRPPIAFGRGRGRGIDCCRTHAAGPGRGKKKKKSQRRGAFEVNTYVHTRYSYAVVRVQAGSSRPPGPSPVCLWIGRTRSLRWSTLAVDQRTWTDRQRQPGVGQRPPSVTRHHQLIE